MFPSSVRRWRGHNRESATTWESLKRKHLGVTLTQLAWQETFFEETAMSKKETGSNDAARWLKPSAREFPPARSLTNLASLCVLCNAGSPGPVSNVWIA